MTKSLSGSERPVGGGDISGALDPLQLRQALSVLTDPRALVSEMPRLAAEWVKVALGLSELSVPERDTVFDDPVWRDHPLFRRLAQAHLAWADVVGRMVDRREEDWQSQERARYLANILTGALTPTNFLATNPVALRKAVDTGGLSVARGARNFLRDLRSNRGMPSMVDRRPYQVGVNVGCTPGAVVHRDEMFEVLQYTPTTSKVRERPLIIVPPELNRHYVLDLSPGRSLVEFAVSRGVQTFMVVWRNPRKDASLKHGYWGLADYIEAHVRAFEVVRDVTGAEDLNLLGLCAGGMTSAIAQAYLAAHGENPIASATYLVTMLDARQPNMVTTMATPGVAAHLAKKAKNGAVIDSKSVAHNFAWMRPTDLVFNYVVNNWLLGNNPPAFDVLAWNDDATNMSSTFSMDSNAMLASGEIVEPGRMTLLDTPIDLSRVKADNFIVAGERDHITTWRPCYMTSQLLGGDSEMVLVNSGHIQSFVNPVGKSRYKYWAGPAGGPDPDSWREQAELNDGTWWPRWAEWLLQRSGGEQPAPTNLGSIEHPAQEPAPGLYVHEK